MENLSLFHVEVIVRLTIILVVYSLCGRKLYCVSFKCVIINQRIVRLIVFVLH